MAISTYVTLRRLLLAATIMASPLALMAPAPARAQIAIGISVQIAPPLLPVYVQPPMPELGYIWTPGYWAYADADYYWVPGTWVQPPTVNVLWTPPYWGWVGGAYLFHDGYWGPHVGFYGGVNYGYGYGGSGYDGGRWDGGNFAYNRSANNFGSVHVEHAYEQNLGGGSRSNVSYTGGAGGIRAEPTAAERSAESERHVPVTAEQTRHVSAALGNPAFAASHNNGHPAITATSRPGAFEGAGAARAQPAAAAAREARPAAAATAEHETARPAGGAATAEHATARPTTTGVTAEHEAARPAAGATAEHATARPAAAPHQAAARPAAAPHQAAARPAAAPHQAAPRPAAAHAAPAHAEQHAEKK